MNSADFISHNMIISEIARKSGDIEFKYASSRELMSSVQEAISELSLDTLFLKSEKVYETKDGLELELPSGSFNIREIYAYNGEDCNPINKKNIYWKNNYKSKISRDNWGNDLHDPFYRSRGESNPPGNLYYAGISNGIVYLSDSCKNLSKVVVRFNSIGTNIGETPSIPIFFRTAIVDYSIVDVLGTRIASNPTSKFLNVWQATLNRTETKLNKPYDGTWAKAKFRAKNLDKKIRDDINEYLSRLNY